MSERVEKIRVYLEQNSSTVRTHYDGCWRKHPLCLAWELLTAYDTMLRDLKRCQDVQDALADVLNGNETKDEHTLVVSVKAMRAERDAAVGRVEEYEKRDRDNNMKVLVDLDRYDYLLEAERTLAEVRAECKAAKDRMWEYGKQVDDLHAREGCWHGDKGHPCLLDKVRELEQREGRMREALSGVMEAAEFGNMAQLPPGFWNKAIEQAQQALATPGKG